MVARGMVTNLRGCPANTRREHARQGSCCYSCKRWAYGIITASPSIGISPPKLAGLSTAVLVCNPDAGDTKLRRSNVWDIPGVFAQKVVGQYLCGCSLHPDWLGPLTNFSLSSVWLAEVVDQSWLVCGLCSRITGFQAVNENICPYFGHVLFPDDCSCNDCRNPGLVDHLSQPDGRQTEIGQRAQPIRVKTTPAQVLANHLRQSGGREHVLAETPSQSGNSPPSIRIYKGLLLRLSSIVQMSFADDSSCNECQNEALHPVARARGHSARVRGWSYVARHTLASSAYLQLCSAIGDAVTMLAAMGRRRRHRRMRRVHVTWHLDVYVLDEAEALPSGDHSVIDHSQGATVPELNYSFHKSSVGENNTPRTLLNNSETLRDLWDSYFVKALGVTGIQQFGDGDLGSPFPRLPESIPPGPGDRSIPITAINYRDCGRGHGSQGLLSPLFTVQRQIYRQSVCSTQNQAPKVAGVSSHLTSIPFGSSSVYLRLFHYLYIPDESAAFRCRHVIYLYEGVKMNHDERNVDYSGIHFMYGKSNGNALEAARLYAEAFPHRRCPDRRTLIRTHQRLREIKSFVNQQRPGKPSCISPDSEDRVLGRFTVCSATDCADQPYPVIPNLSRSNSIGSRIFFRAPAHISQCRSKAFCFSPTKTVLKNDQSQSWLSFP
ncbi:hypothetical protein PR048_019929 [Dryococelus australis]|uniref:DUF4817 domain-containing protein n=1 Tax=Dryococelus australis TaxID=614101 RepID=A0ABQ9H525_9NEOP|nr:hypothetical protein PR048_019929 [Dryococelus australis]